ncbi:unnamed protein product [Spirodela intermedia]|uniref:VOC domain-containing protein n=2 Tax=Spirodela intermedia TaxID=51605 RepID=A0A7I8KR80_SPIIN|nr:unnamed protein product [Spirodela intermedia]CAA6663819.1 unnamed protein product [Spirodela intermedia]CAA7400317.1 unnamed protein product [Spirodela intermedia]
MGLEIIEEVPPLPLMGLNHISFVVRSVSRSVEFYEEVLGFVSIKRPSSFKFEGAWLFNYGVGIHLLESSTPEEAPKKKATFDMRMVAKKLDEMGIEYITAVVEEGGVFVDQLFFHDPDGYMVEVCNCQVLPICPLSQSNRLPLPLLQNLMAGGGDPVAALYLKELATFRCAAEVGNRMMESLVTEIMNISF